MPPSSVLLPFFERPCALLVKKSLDLPFPLLSASFLSSSIPLSGERLPKFVSQGAASLGSSLDHLPQRQPHDSEAVDFQANFLLFLIIDSMSPFTNSHNRIPGPSPPPPEASRGRCMQRRPQLHRRRKRQT
ncbi:unnamed protein product, partial [Phaeothamnion confervicola]